MQSFFQSPFAVSLFSLPLQSPLLPPALCLILIVMVHSMTALHYAVEENHLDIVKILLAEAKRLNQPEVVLAQDRGLNTPLHVACRSGHAAVFQALMKTPNRRELLELTNDDDSNCLHVAAAAGHERIGELLFQEDARLLEDVDFRRNRPIHLAAAEGHASFVRMLLAGGAPVDVRYARVEWCGAKSSSGWVFGKAPPHGVGCMHVATTRNGPRWTLRPIVGTWTCARSCWKTTPPSTQQTSTMWVARSKQSPGAD